MNVFIDVRGPWPVLFVGNKTFTLERCGRGVTIEHAMKLAGLEPEEKVEVSQS